MSDGGARSGAHVTVRTRRMWSLRASLGLTRWVIYAVALAGIAATVRNVVAPATRPVAPSSIATAPAPGADAGAEWFAMRFARAYLTWSPDTAARSVALAPFLGTGEDAGAGVLPATGTHEAVAWEAIAAARPLPGGGSEYTVAVATTGGAVRYLALAVAPSGVRLLRDPALVGQPPMARSIGLSDPALPQLEDPAVVTVLDRALRNYLAGSTENLAADLAPGAVLEPAPPGVALRRVVALAVEDPLRVLATVLVADAGGTTYTLGYEIAVERLGQRWEITRIES